MFVSLEGIDGAGKTTLSRELAELLRADGRPVTLLRKSAPPRLRDPYADKELRDLARRLYSDWRDVPALASFGELHCILTNASYYALLDTCVIGPALGRGEIVIVDGWFYKLVARILHNGDGSVRDAMPYFGGIRTPDRSILLNVAAETAASRLPGYAGGETGAGNIGKSGSLTAFISYQRKVAYSLYEIARSHEWDIIDNHASISDTVATLGKLLATGHVGLSAGGTPMTA